MEQILFDSKSLQLSVVINENTGGVIYVKRYRDSYGNPYATFGLKQHEFAHLLNQAKQGGTINVRI